MLFPAFAKAIVGWLGAATRLNQSRSHQPVPSQAGHQYLSSGAPAMVRKRFTVAVVEQTFWR
jgi:hypothetical protein